MRVFHRRAWPDYKRQEEFLKEVADALEGKGRVNEVNGNFQGGGREGWSMQRGAQA